MSQSYFSDRQPTHEPDDESSSNAQPESSHPDDQPVTQRPNYMTVGNGAHSVYADELMARLDHDSGYGSIASGHEPDSGDLQRWRNEFLQDRPTPAHTPQHKGKPGMSENEKVVLASHVHQLYYNQNRVALAKAIGQTVELLKQLQEMNAQWPAHYPSVRRPEVQQNGNAPLNVRPGLQQTQTTVVGAALRHGRPIAPQRAETSVGHSSAEVGIKTSDQAAIPQRAGTSVPEGAAESSSSAQNRTKEEPRLITPQIAQEFSILKLDLKVGALSQAELVHSLEKKSIASLLDGKISQSIRHLLLLRDRIEDTSSKVLVTGDLNAGKSTFCNALLRRKILPEDQQPCTNIFCEVLDARDNGGMEEVHAVHKDVIYNRNDESTYDAYTLQELEKIVIDSDRYMQCKVYVKDVRSVDESLLNNGVVDIALIDAPGLNSDSVKTTAVFARQEEIDVVVFVVSAANHFTLSAKDFIWQAAHEKAYMFMVVNGFDNIRDKERCQTQILQQLTKLSPQTFKEASELVHFVSSNAIPVQPQSDGRISSGPGGSGPGGDGDDDNDNDDNSDAGKGKGKDKEKIQDFRDLEGALRRFILEKRARSKLAPAKTYLMNCLGDIHVLATVNRDVAQSELDRVAKELSELEPQFEEKSKQKSEVSEKVEKDVDDVVTEVYNHTRSTLSTTIATVGDSDLGIEYPGLFSMFQFADDLRVAMLDQITTAVRNCEDYGRASTVRGVNMIKSLGLLHVGNSYDSLSFRADMMFGRKKDVAARSIDTDVEIWDFFDLSGFWEKQEKVVGSGMALTIVGTIGSRAVGGFGWVDGAMGAARVVGYRNIQRLIVPGMLVAVGLTAAYMLSVVPQTLPPRLARKISQSLAEMDYTHTNASRISAEVRRNLRFPSQQLTVDLQRNVEELKQKKEEVTQTKKESEIARKYFTNLVRETADGRRRIESVDLEGPAPGGAGAYASL